MSPPPFFDRIRTAASRRWDQLEQDPELAAPWHQLFKQVQSPRHVVSELLQNADDAGATEASVTIDDSEFVFSHDGGDFTEANFASLCRFGYSDKRALHTIGFRGVGFKSTFSLGDEVRLLTPTLSVAFHRGRFTEPVWIGPQHPRQGTQIRVRITDQYRLTEAEDNLQQWLDNPESLLFFRQLRCLRVRDQELRWVEQAPGPIPGSAWMTPSTYPDERYLLLRSAEEEFPEDAVREIHSERGVAVDDTVGLPPCRVEIVLGVEGRLFVVLPTGVETALPFASNAPFVQDPARMRIKEPAISPTNRWLLERVGRLAGSALLAWLHRVDLGPEQRARAYELLPDLDRAGRSLEERCATIVGEAMERVLDGHRCVLAQSSELMPSSKCHAVDSALLDVWSLSQVQSSFLPPEGAVLSQSISRRSTRRLIAWGLARELPKASVLDVLASKHLPQPDTWRQLLILWGYVSPEVTDRYSYPSRKGVRIVPVQGKDVLCAADDVVRLSDKRLLHSEQDWRFVAQYLSVLSQEWARYVAEQRRVASEHNDRTLGSLVDAAHRVLSEFDLADASDVGRVIGIVAQHVFAATCELADCVRLAHIAAAIDAPAGDSFRFVTRDGRLRTGDDTLLVDLDGDLDMFVSEDWYQKHVLHSAYSDAFAGCTKEAWARWVTSGRTSLHTFVPLLEDQKYVGGRERISALLRSRMYDGPIEFHYRGSQFVFRDWDYEAVHWQLWEALARADPSFWGRLMARILRQPESYWSPGSSASAIQVAKNGHRRVIVRDNVLPAWITTLREVPCLQDTWGAFQKPSELLRRTPDTEALLGIEPFVRAELDIEATRPLLVMLGVRAHVSGPEPLLERLRVLSRAGSVPFSELERWFGRLDQMLTRCSTEDIEEVKHVFAQEPLVPTATMEWARTEEVFLAADEDDVPGAAIVHPALRHMALWLRIGVPERPTTELAIAWLRGMPCAQQLAADQLRRIRALLARHPARIWQECGRWLNLDGHWVDTEDLEYALSMQSLAPSKHLFPAIRQRVADLTKLSAETCCTPPFSDLPSLLSAIEDRLTEGIQCLAEPETRPWLGALAKGLMRVSLGSQEDTSRIRTLAHRLWDTQWQVVADLEIVPYIDGTPAGIGRRVPALWRETLLYVEGRSEARLARAVANEIGRAFDSPEILDAIKMCVGRTEEFIAEYLEENLTLVDADAVKHALPSSGETDSRELQPVPPVPPAEAGDPASTSSTVPVTGEELPPNTSTLDPPLDDGQNVPQETPARRSVHSKPPRPSIVERFAKAHGYAKDGHDRFHRPDGALLQKVPNSMFPWEERSPGGDLMRCYLAREHCVQAEPLKVEADAWALLERSPGTHALLLEGPSGEPVALTGYLLRKLVNSNQLTVHPAMFRLVYHADT